MGKRNVDGTEIQVLQIEEDGTPFYTQVQMAAVIDPIGTMKPDPDNGKIYGIKLKSSVEEYV